MGTPKQLLTLGGRSFLARVVAALVPAVEEVVLVGDGELPADVPPLTRLADAPGLSGPLAGILAALAWRPHAAWIVAACDLPLATPEAIAWLCAERRPGAIAVLPRRGADPGGPVEPLLALYEPAARPRLQALAAGRGPAASLQRLAAAPDVRTPTPPATLAAAWSNVNTPEDLDGIGEMQPPAPR
jgi:molybdopterin-guanine dinucleotide biosynthesis protein A